MRLRHGGGPFFVVTLVDASVPLAITLVFLSLFLPLPLIVQLKIKEGVGDSRVLKDSNTGMIEEVAVLDWCCHRGPLNSIVSGSGVNQLCKSISMGTDAKSMCLIVQLMTEIGKSCHQ